MADLAVHFFSVINPLTFGLVFCGVVGGVMFGALPGLTATMGVTLLMPFTLGLQLTPQDSIALLVGIYIGAIYGGSIAAIMISTPGTPAAAATVLDGFPMTQRGEAGKALVLATLASFTGGIISVFVLTFLSPQISRFALFFSYPEYFALAIFGLSMIITISGSDIIKGLISGIFGLLIATVGLDGVTGVPRFAFGQADLYEGIGFIPVLIGLFAFAQVFVEISNTLQAKLAVSKINFSFPSIKELISYKFTFLRSGFMGTFIGSLPGAGCDIAAFVSYNEAKRISKNPERFGQGEPRGIIAAEAANNGATGGAMIPMLTLGVPGDAVTAIMLNALIVQNVQPGPQLFQERPETVYPIFGSMLMANIVMVLVGLFAAKYLSRLMLVRKSILLPIICVLSVVGAYALQNSMFHVWVAIGFGVIGFGMRIWNFPASPIVLALILGPMAEDNLRTAFLQPDTTWMTFFTRPISCTLLLVAFLSIAFGLWRQFKHKKNGSEAEQADS